MEIKNCEQYVLAELEAARKESKRLEGELARAIMERDNMKLRAEELWSRLNAEPGTLEKAVIKEGRDRLFGGATYADSTPATDADGNPYAFRIWCEECMSGYGRPKGVSVDEFIRYFEPEFRKAYDKQLKDEE